MKLVVGGQMDKKAVEKILQKLVGDRAEIVVMSDIEGAMAIKKGTADYYFGACATGAGGALGIAMSLAGRDKCVSVSIPGKVMSEAEIEAEVKAGKKAFGFVNYDAEKVIPHILKAIGVMS